MTGRKAFSTIIRVKLLSGESSRFKQATGHLSAGFFVFLISVSTSVAQAWVDNPVINTPIAKAPFIQSEPDLVADGAGGAFAVWRDDRDGTNCESRIDTEIHTAIQIP